MWNGLNIGDSFAKFERLTRDLYLQRCCCVQKLVGATKSLKIPLYEGLLDDFISFVFLMNHFDTDVFINQMISVKLDKGLQQKKNTNTQLSKV